MMMTFTLRIALVLIATLLLLAETVHAQDSLDAARELYASAEYEEALRVLDRLTPRTASTEERRNVELYRALCLLAVGRQNDALRAIDAIVETDPFYRPGDELPPRTRTAFSEARKRRLPAVVQQQYAHGKAAFDRQEFDAAAGAFKRVLDALDDPDMQPAARQPPLDDLFTLAAGFHDLSVKALLPPPPPPALPAPEPEPEPAAPAPPTIYGGDEAGIRHPATLSQDLPRYPGSVPPQGLRGIVEVVIDERGNVESVTMIVPISSSYDRMVLTAASRWRYVPAMMNGAPVKFRKRVQINITPPTTD